MRPLPLNRRLGSSLIALVASLSTSSAVGQQPGPGETTYREICAACHGTGVPKAPQLGNRRHWAPLIREGQAVLTSHAWVGVRGMPARGGRNDLDLDAFSGAVAYMARSAGADWQAPDSTILRRIEAEVRKREAARKGRKPG